MCTRQKRCDAVRLVLAISCLLCTQVARAESKSTLRQPLRKSIDQIVQQILESTGVPSASIAIVKDGRIVYVHAYGNACLDPRKSARPEMRYSIGSVSKQFTAAAILLLAQQHKLSLDDLVSRFLPTLPHSEEVTIRELLSHTSGYQDYWPQDYVPPFMLVETTPDEILRRWAAKPLDFEPGTQWQYSNTNFVIAGLIVEKVSGMPLTQFLTENVSQPLGMSGMTNVDEARLSDSDATGYLRYALGPARPAPKEAKGWLFAAAELAMSAQDLAKWDISILNQTLLDPISSREMQTEVLLKNGQSTQYGLGIRIKREFGHRALEHGGDVSGFTAENMIFPDDRFSVSVLTNQDVTDAAPETARRIARLFFSEDMQAREKKTQLVREIFESLQGGSLDRSLLTVDGNSYFTKQAIKDFARSLAPLGPPAEFIQTGQEERGGMTFRSYEIKFRQQTLDLWVREMPDGKIEQYQLAVKPKPPIP